MNGGEELRNYNDLINVHNRDQEDGYSNWICKDIIGHKLQNRRYYVKVLWDNGESSWESLNIMKASDPMKVSKYATIHELNDKHGWR